MRYPLHASRLTALLLAVTGALLARDGASATISPDWVARLAVGANLSSGIRGMAVAPSGIAYVTSTSGSFPGTDITTAAYLPDGSLLWSSTIGGPEGAAEQARAITIGGDGGIYVVGNRAGAGHYANVLVLEHDAGTGKLLRTIEYSGGAMLSELGASVVADAAGNIFVAGATVGDGGDVLVLAFAPDGTLIWRRTWDGPADAPWSQDGAMEILFDPNGDLAVLAHGVTSWLHSEFVVLEYATDGSTIWQAEWGAIGDSAPRDMEIDPAGDIYVTGTCFAPIQQYCTVKLRGFDGGLTWRAFDSGGPESAAAALALDDAGALIVTGTVDPDGDLSNLNDNIFTVERLASSGERVWAHSYGADCLGCFDSAADVIASPGGLVFVAGSTNSPPYSADRILLVLDGRTGLERDRGSIAGEAATSATAGILAFDAWHHLYDGGQLEDPDGGSVELVVARWAPPAPIAGDWLFADSFECGSTTLWSDVP
jgi:hypothetical protein